MVDAGDHVDQGRFAAARLAHDAGKFAALEPQGDILERGELAGGGLESFDHVLQLDKRSGG